ncbi:MAG: hypothetical protein ABW032_02610 [Burkholderiaceae bacterium]
MADFNPSFNLHDPSADQMASGPSSVPRASTWSVEQPSDQMGGTFGLERHHTAPVMRPLGATLGVQGIPATELVSLLPLRANHRIKLLNKTAGLMSQSMQAQYMTMGSTAYPAMDVSLPLTSRDAARQTRFAGGEPQPEFNVVLSTGWRRDQSMPTQAPREITTVTITPTDNGSTVSGFFEWVDSPNVYSYSDKIGSAGTVEPQGAARIGVHLIGLTLSNLRHGSGKELPREPGESRRIEIKVRPVMGGDELLTVEIGAKADGSFELQVYDSLNECELFVQFPAENAVPDANEASLLLSRLPHQPRKHLAILVELISMATKAMAIQKESTAFPLMNQMMDLASPERSEELQAAGREPMVAWTVCLSERMEFDFADPNQPMGRPVIGMTVDAHKRDRVLSGHLEWIGEQPGDEFAAWVGPLPNADAQASARKALFLLGKALPHLEESNAQAMDPRPGETGRIKLALPSTMPGVAAPMTMELGYTEDGCLGLEVHHMISNRTLAAQFNPGAPQLLKSSPEVYENLDLLSNACTIMAKSLQDHPPVPGASIGKRRLKQPAFVRQVKLEWLEGLKLNNAMFADWTEAAIVEFTRKSPALMAELQNKLDDLGDEIEISFLPIDVTSGFIQDGFNPPIPNQRRAMGMAITSLTDEQSLTGHFAWAKQPNDMSLNEIRQAAYRMGTAFRKLPLANGKELMPLLGERKRMQLSLAGPGIGQDGRFQVMLTISSDGDTVDLQISDVNNQDCLNVQLTNGSNALIPADDQLKARRRKSDQMVLNTLTNSLGQTTPPTPADEQSLLELQCFTEYLQVNDGPSLHDLLRRKASGDEAFFNQHVAAHWLAQIESARNADAMQLVTTPIDQRREAFVDAVEKVGHLFASVPFAQ